MGNAQQNRHPTDDHLRGSGEPEIIEKKFVFLPAVLTLTNAPNEKIFFPDPVFVADDSLSLRTSIRQRGGDRPNRETHSGIGGGTFDRQRQSQFYG